MASPGGLFISLGALFDEPSDDVILNRLKTLAAEILPEGWRVWQLVHSYAEPSVDPAVLNKLRFALPTEGIARAFDPAAVSLKEHPFRDMRVKMLEWPFCRGLIFSPSSLSMMIRGSALQHEFVMQSISGLRSSFLSREAADQLLSGESHSLPARRSSRSSNEVAEPQDSRLGALEKRFASQDARTKRVEDTLAEILKQVRRRDPSPVSEDEVSVASSSSFHSSLSGSRGCWVPPPLLQEEIVVEPDLPPAPFAFAPVTKEREPDIPEPSAELEATGVACQRFNSKAWCNIRYLEAQKELQAGGSFARLQVNPELLGRSSAFGDLLANTEGALGSLCHGLLLQRQVLADAINQVIEKHPAAAPDLRMSLSGSDSQFLQFVCGKRAELIESRRKIVESNTNVPPRILRDIPPAGGFLFEPKQLADTLRNQPGTSRAPQRRHPHNATLRKPAPRGHRDQDSRPFSAARKRPAPSNDYQASKRKKIADKAGKSRGHKFPDKRRV
uniref:Uncharacterized protein n=1 Tax=Cacopsylla melanoneura TaxID=428564 RepID=A0A8D8QWQ1_9HEMI